MLRAKPKDPPDEVFLGGSLVAPLLGMTRANGKSGSAALFKDARVNLDALGCEFVNDSRDEAGRDESAFARRIEREDVTRDHVFRIAAAELANAQDPRLAIGRDAQLDGDVE